MTEDTGDFRAEVGAALAETLPAEGVAGPEAHPTVDELIAYREGLLAEPDTDRLQEHLVTCRECLDRLSELEGFVEAGEQGPSGVKSVEEASAWRALGQRRKTPDRTVPLALAASFLVAAIGLGLWVVQLRNQLTELSKPQPATQVFDLFSDAHVRSSEGNQPGPIDLSSVGHLTLILRAQELPEFAAYEAEIVDAEGRELWRGRIAREEDGAFLLGIPRSFVGPGSYRIDLYGIDGAEPGDSDSRQHLAAFPLDLVLGDDG